MAEEYAINVQIILYKEEGRPPVIRQVFATQDGKERTIEGVPSLTEGQVFTVEEDLSSNGYILDIMLTRL